MRPLPSTFNPSPAVAIVCDQALLQGTLEVDRGDPWAAWLEANGGRVNVLWPPGFSIAFGAQGSQLIAPDGHVVAVEGDQLKLGGGMGEPGVFAACEVNGVQYNQ